MQKLLLRRPIFVRPVASSSYKPSESIGIGNFVAHCIKSIDVRGEMPQLSPAADYHPPSTRSLDHKSPQTRIEPDLRWALSRKPWGWASLARKGNVADGLDVVAASTPAAS